MKLHEREQKDCIYVTTNIEKYYLSHS